MRGVRGNVQQLTGSRGEMLPQPLAVPHSGLAGEDVDPGLVVLVIMGPGPAPWRDRDEVHAEPGGAYSLRRDPGDVVEVLLSVERLPRVDDHAGGLLGRHLPTSFPA